MGKWMFWEPAVRRASILAVGVSASLLLVALLLTDLRAVLWQTKPVLSLQPQPAQVQLSFPYAIEGTQLIAERVAVYEGPFVEDGAGREVSNVAALVLRNGGHTEIRQAEVVLKQGNRQLTFRASHIPAGAAVLALEVHAGTYQTEPYTACSGWSTLSHSETLLPQQLQVEVVDMGALEVTNLTDTAMEKIVLYYKTWSGEAGIYIGGITYTTLIDTLEPGQTVRLQPYHFASGYSKVLKAEIG